MSKGWMSGEEAIAHIMKTTGRNRRQAIAMLMKHMRSGEIKAMKVNSETGEEVAVDPRDVPPVQ